MKTLIKTALIVAILPLTASAVFAGSGNGNGNGRGIGNAGHPHGCPPGLAKRNPPCVPPGHARFERGDYFGDHEFDRILDIARYGLDDRNSYYRVGDMIYQADPDTFRVLNVIGVMSDLLN